MMMLLPSECWLYKKIMEIMNLFTRSPIVFNYKINYPTLSSFSFFFFYFKKIIGALLGGGFQLDLICSRNRKEVHFQIPK